MGIDWSRVRLTEHMTEAAAVVAECHVVLEFGTARAQYEVKVYRDLKGAGADPYFAVGVSPDATDGYRPSAGGETAEAALEACLATAGIHHRRLVKQATE